MSDVENPRVAPRCNHHERFIAWEDHSRPIYCAMCEIERLRASLAPFAAVAKGIPDNWPGECHLRIDSDPVVLGDFTGCREWLCYHGINDVQDACLPTIAQWREAARAADGEGEDATSS